MGNASSSEDGAGLGSPKILSKVTVNGGKADMDAFLTEGRVDNVEIAYVTKKQVRATNAAPATAVQEVCPHSIPRLVGELSSPPAPRRQHGGTRPPCRTTRAARMNVLSRGWLGSVRVQMPFIFFLFIGVGRR